MYTPFLLLIILVIFTTFSYSSYAADFCVADLTAQRTPYGYPCKNSSSVTSTDFVFSRFVTQGNTTNPNKLSLVRAFVDDFPALNGLNLAAVRVDMEPDGVVPLHSHPSSSEMVFVVEGSVTVGFISGLDSNIMYANKLSKGQVMVIPQGFLHFQHNSGSSNAVLFVSFASSDPGVQFVTSALFRNRFPSFLVEKTTGISQAEVRQLKARLGGTG
ncbi:unnamed protein product [Linum tenue]|uniref:Germin-like protein n=1 Tax=Linum tenue TaxID=586396 RepID=A0AAV0KC24_9ROSI|nr:unnamed protein product [Linum tenue]